MKKSISIIILIVSFISVRFGLFELYKSYDAPIIALLPAIAGIILTVMFNCQITMTGTSFGYIVSFILAQLFKTEYIDKFTLLEHNSIMETFTNLYRDEVEASFRLVSL